MELKKAWISHTTLYLLWNYPSKTFHCSKYKLSNVIEGVVIVIGCVQSAWARHAPPPVYFCSICWVACRITACQNLSHPTRSLPSSCCCQSRHSAQPLLCSPALTRLLSQPSWRMLSFHLTSRHPCQVSFILEMNKKIFIITIVFYTFLVGLVGHMTIEGPLQVWVWRSGPILAMVEVNKYGEHSLSINRE